MIRQDSVPPNPGSKHAPKRVGRGNGSGHGNYATRGKYGQKSRSGYSRRPGFEGGQLPLIKRLPEKRGFYSKFRTSYSIVNVAQLNGFEAGTEVTFEALLAVGLVETDKLPVKILGDGDLVRALTVKANQFSASAKAKIEAAGGKVEEVEYAPKAK